MPCADIIFQIVQHSTIGGLGVYQPHLSRLRYRFLPGDASQYYVLSKKLSAYASYSILLEFCQGVDCFIL